MAYDMIAIGASTGGIDALKALLPRIEHPVSVPIVVVQHLEPRSASYLDQILAGFVGLKGHEAEDKMPLVPGHLYTPAPNYHLMMEKDWTLTLTVDKKVCYARPSIDVFFESAVDALKESLIGVLLTGANEDGACGMRAIHEAGGYTIVQSPEEAACSEMPGSAIKLCPPRAVLTLNQIAERLNDLLKQNEECR